MPVTSEIAPRVVDRELFIPHENGRGVFPGFIGYVDAPQPMLLHRYGRMDFADTYDDFADSISRDNGRTWSDSVLRLKSQATAGGRVRYAENAAIWDAQTNRMLTFTSRGVYPKDGSIQSTRWELELGSYDPVADQWAAPSVTRFGFEEGVAVSFSFPIETSAGRLLVPMQKPKVDQQGRDVVLPGYWSRQYESRVLIGEHDAGGRLQWRAGGQASLDASSSSRGVYEPTIAELNDGRIAMICRGDNGYFPDRPGCKWVSFSDNGGESWSNPGALTFADGAAVESASSGSALIRSIANGKLYWIGNLCLDGERPNGGWPRSPLHIAEISEEPFGIVPGSVVEIDRRRESDSPRVQLSNFRYYQDRQTGEIVVLMSRLGEEDAQAARRANYYRYRIEVDD